MGAGGIAHLVLNPKRPRPHHGTVGGAGRLLRWVRRGKLANSEAGFTLVEVIVAIAILALGLGALLEMISSSLRQMAEAKRMAEAGALTQSLFAEVGTARPIREGQSDGQFPNGYHWRLNMERYGDAIQREQWPVGAYVVSTEVTWLDGTHKRSYALTTLRLGPKEARP